MVTKPQDHKTSKQKQNEKKQLRFEEVDGCELLKPFGKVKGSDQLRLMSRLNDLGVLDGDDSPAAGDDDGIDLNDLDIDKLADLIDYVGEKFALNTEKFEEFTTGKGGFNRALNLSIAYAGELGNGEASENS